jgi:hypothetical protein
MIGITGGKRSAWGDTWRGLLLLFFGKNPSWSRRPGSRIVFHRIRRIQRIIKDYVKWIRRPRRDRILARRRGSWVRDLQEEARDRVLHGYTAENGGGRTNTDPPWRPPPGRVNR